MEAGHIKEIQFPKCLSNAVVVVKGSMRTWWMCIDFIDLNKACRKDSYPLPMIDQLVDSTSRYELLLMMDAYQGYHHIKMDLKDMAKVAFRVSCGTYGYVNMPFGLKNVGATYQRMTDKIFKEQIGRNVEVYIDDMLVKSQRVHTHSVDLNEIFTVLRSYRLKLNSTKCAFGVKSGKFLGYVVTPKGIKVNQEKVKAVREITAPLSIREIQKLNGWITVLSIFISRSADKSLPFFKVLRKKS